MWRISSLADSVSTELVLTINTGTGKTVESIVHHPTSSEVCTTKAVAFDGSLTTWKITSSLGPTRSLLQRQTISFRSGIFLARIRELPLLRPLTR